MKTTQTIKTIASFCEASHLSPKLIRAVVRQMGGWESFTSAAPDISAQGIDGGFSGFIYNVDTEAFAKRNRSLIADMAAEQADDMGTGVIGMIQGFGCFRNSPPTEEAVAMALYAGKEAADGEWNVLNALAWYAGEEVARSYNDLAEQSA